MAESVVSFFIANVGPLLTEEANLLLGVKEQVKSLNSKLIHIHSFLKDADEKRKKNETLKVWVSQIRDVAYEVEDVIDSFIVEVERQRRKNFILRCINFHNRLLATHKSGKQILDIQRRLQEISDNMTNYNLQRIQLQESSKQVLEANEKRSPIVEEVDVVGFGKDAEKIEMLLTRAKGCRAVVSIVGMGGLGKTSLAKLVYNSSNIKKHFNSRAWIYVSQDCRPRDLLESIAKQVMGDEGKGDLPKNVDDLREMLSNYLKKRRYLIVIDDIWKEVDWDVLISALPDEGIKESRVLLTTRKRDVASHAQNLIEPHELCLLNAKESWELFSKRVNCPTELEELGKNIVSKCGGLPLAIVVLGGLCRKHKTHNGWSKILDNAIWQLCEDQNRCADVLALSYCDLPSYLKSCFLYFSLFPEVYSIRADRLIQLWVAEGFVQKKGKQTMEDVAEDYLEQLIDRSMIQATQRRSDGGIESCRIQDVLRETALKEAKQDNFLDISGDEAGSISASSRSSRRLAIHPVTDNTYDTFLPNDLSSNLKLCSLLCFTSSQEIDLWESFSYGGRIKLLRVLDLEGAYIDELPEEIGELILLKYLGLRGTKISDLPSSAANLRNLQTLDLKCTNISNIPSWVWKMHRLRHVYLLDANESGSSSRPPRIDHLRDLVTLELQTGSWILGGLNKLVNLRKFSTIGEVSTLYREAISDALAKLTSLRSLYLEEKHEEPTFLPLTSFSFHRHLFQLTLIGRLQKLPNLNEFPPNLTELKLSSSHLRQQDDAPPMISILEKLPTLKMLALELDAYEEKKIICSAGGFAELDCLILGFLDNLEEWIVEEGAMPRLKYLYLGHCMQLKMIPDGFRHITTLQEIILNGMPQQFIARIEENKGEDWFKIQHIPSIKYD